VKGGKLLLTQTFFLEVKKLQCLLFVLSSTLILLQTTKLSVTIAGENVDQTVLIFTF